MRVLLIVLLFVVSACGQVNITGTNICDGLNTIKPVSVKAIVTEKKLAPAVKAEHSLLLYRMLHTL
ncbi:MAG: hypothetical protein H7Y31_04295 [Chitinophagaceae bacterium]|nr:hypothetical protein [Chitinophagaceae bacterium]